MTITIVIPQWLIYIAYIIGSIAVLLIIAFAIFGIIIFKELNNFRF